MAELFRTLVIRPAEKLPPIRKENLGHKTHPKHLQSDTYLRWCEEKNYERLIAQLNEFLKNDETISSLEQIPEDLRKPIEYAEYHGFDFKIDAFLKELDFRKIGDEYGGKEFKEKVGTTKETNYSRIRKNFSDSLLARVKLNKWKDLNFDLRRAILTLDLVGDLYKKGREAKYTMNVADYYRKPFILDSCILKIDPCDLKEQEDPTIGLPVEEQHTELEMDNVQKTDAEDDEKCPCNQFLDKIYKCDCEKEVEDDCDCKSEQDCEEQDSCCAKIEPYVAELFIVKDEVSAYEPGEMSYIENIIKGEKRVRTHRHLQREELYSEKEEETNTYEERDQQVEEQFALHKEIDKIVEQDLSVDAGVSYESNTGVKQIRAHLNATYDLAKKDSRKIVQDESKKIITKAISKVEKKIRTLSTRKLINETEEVTKHKFDNTDPSNTDISRQFYYVNQVRKAQVFSYGARMFLDFYIPEPSELLKRLLEKEFKLKEPKKPCLHLSDIKPEDYLKYVECFGFYDLEKPKEQPPIKWIRKTYKNSDIDTKHGSFEEPITIDEGYTAVLIEMDDPKLVKKPVVPAHHRLRIVLGGGVIHKSRGPKPRDDNENYSDPTNVRGSATLLFSTLELKAYEVNVRIKLVPDQVDNTEWKIDILNRVNSKYQKELDDYNRKLQEFEQNKQTKYNQNPFMLSETIKEQLKHQAINYISCQFFEENDAMKDKVKPCGFPQMDIREAHKEGEFVRFFEQAFEWKFMSYMLYNYFWGRNYTWADKLQEKSQNGLFTKFLQAGYARVSLSVRPGFEGHVSYYLQNRYISPFGIPDISADALPIHQEIKESKDNFNTDRDGHLIWDDSTSGYGGLKENQILLRDNTDYFKKDQFGNLILDSNGDPIFDSTLTEPDINREINIDCITYRIVDISYDNKELIITLATDLKLHCPRTLANGDKETFFDRHKEKQLSWSTGAEFIGAPWIFKVPTSLVWLREEEGCLPCYPINCEEK